MTSRPKRADAVKYMEVDCNQDTVNSTMPIINSLKKNWKQKKGWRQNNIGIKKVSGNYDLYLAYDYSQMRAVIFLEERLQIY